MSMCRREKGRRRERKPEATRCAVTLKDWNTFVAISMIVHCRCRVLKNETVYHYRFLDADATSGHTSTGQRT
jgi:hypothetical protein